MSPLSPTLPGPSLPRVIRSSIRPRDGMIGVLRGWAEEYGDRFTFKVGRRRFFYFREPEAVRQILQDLGKKLETTNDNMARFTGQGLLVSTGETWKSHRRHLQPLFHARMLDGFRERIHVEALRLAERWDKGGEREIESDFLDATLRVATSCFFSTDLSSHSEKLHHAFVDLMRECVRDLKSPFALPHHWPTPRQRRVRRILAELDGILYGLIADRRRRIEADPSAPAADLLTSMIAARDPEGGRSFTDQEVRDELVTFLGAGHETTAMNLTWTIYLLAGDAERQRSLRDALAAGAGDSLLSETWQESLRLYPPAWAFQRKALEDIHVGDVAIPAGSRVLVSPYLTHRHVATWGDPAEFRPERFRGVELPKGAFFPFGLGGRNCIGQHFAGLVAQTFLRALCARFEFKRTGAAVALDPLLALRSRDGVRVAISSIASPRRD